jgi:N-acetylglucosamine kinase-like BadF-type ATPase
LGLDIGGSSSRARLRGNGQPVIDVEGPGANVATLDTELVDDRLTALLAKLGDISPNACCAGAAGAEVPAGRIRLARLLERMFPDCRLTVVHDARLVLAAAGLHSGIALIAGTGSVAYGRTANGREAQRGGWGWMIGDDGGGAWVAREAAREVMRRADAGLPLGELGQSLLAACGASDSRGLTANLHAMREPMQWASAASAVFETAALDLGAMEVVVRAASALAGLVRDIQDSLGVDGPIVLAGGLLLNQPRLEAAVREQVSFPCVRLDEPPVEGAVRLAEELLQR